MFKWVGGFMDRSVAVMGAIVFAQAPAFMQQYTQQMIGREIELRLQVDAIRHAAGISGKTVEQLTQKFIENPDLDIVHQGEMMLATISRWHSISDTLAAMQESTIWSRPIAFLYHLNIDAFISTFHHFKFGLYLNMEGGAYALIGVAIGHLVFLYFKKMFCKMKNLFVKSRCEKPFL